MEREVPTNRLPVLYDQINYVKINYSMNKADKATLARAANIVFGLSRQPAVKPRDVSEMYPLLASQCYGTEEDHELRDQARRLLSQDIRTFDLATQLGRLRPDDECGGTSGWRWLRAAQTILGSTRLSDQQVRSWPFFVGVARRFVEADRLRPLKASEMPEATVEDFSKLFRSA